MIIKLIRRKEDCKLILEFLDIYNKDKISYNKVDYEIWVDRVSKDNWFIDRYDYNKMEETREERPRGDQVREAT